MATTEPRTQDFAASNRGDAPSNATEPVSIGGTGGSTNDPFAAQRTSDNDPFANQRSGDDTLGDLGSSPPAGSPLAGGFPTDRRMSKEWGIFQSPSISNGRFNLNQAAYFFYVLLCVMTNFASSITDASKVPPSRFQRREGSIYATPGSRDAHTGKGKDRDQAYKDKLKERVRVPCVATISSTFQLTSYKTLRVGNEASLSHKAKLLNDTRMNSFGIVRVYQVVWGGTVL
ncbi:MAG: hypothetical protein M1812_000859 [Candelaria pacifica]|nr:MAG: hypothetical protein M1812_000859 [Candelaria pacifica]